MIRLIVIALSVCAVISSSAAPPVVKQPPRKTRVVQPLDISWERQGTTPVKGQISAMALSTRSITIGVLRQAQKLRLAENCQVRLNDNPQAEVKDLRMGMNVVADVFVVGGTPVVAKITEAKPPEPKTPPKKLKNR